MFIACIACGGILELTLLSLGLSFVYTWFKGRHKKETCDCCKEHKEHEEHQDKPKDKSNE